MRVPLLLKVYFALRKGWKRLTPEAKQSVRLFVASQKEKTGYRNAGGKVDDYYTQFGQVLETVISPLRIPLVRPSLTVKESLKKEDVYGCFFRFLNEEMHLKKTEAIPEALLKTRGTNAVCCILASQHQKGEALNAELVEWLKERQHETGGFYANEMAPIPDLLSTAVALFTLRLIGEHAASAKEFVEAHFLKNGSFAPTILDDYSDVEYVFYGLLALGSQ